MKINVKAALIGITTLIFISAFFIDFRFGPDFRFQNKIIDPLNPKFSAKEFRFEDYNNYKDVIFTLQAIFPKGSQKQDVLDFFSRIKLPHETTEILQKEPNKSELVHLIYSFEKKLYFSSCFGTGGKKDNIIFIFNAEEKLTGFYIKNSCGIFVPKGE